MRYQKFKISDKFEISEIFKILETFEMTDIKNKNITIRPKYQKKIKNGK